MRLVATLLALAFVCAAAPAYGQCAKDTDCKGDRVCINGQCADIVRAQPNVPPPPPPVVQPQPAQPPPPQPVYVQPAQPAPQPVYVQPAQPAPAGQPVNVIVNNNAPVVPPQQPLQLQPPKLERKKPKAGWALGAGIVGLVFGGITLGLTAASEATRTHLIPSLPLGAAALVLNIIMIPVTSSGGSSARKGTDLRGVVPLRVFGWIFYAGMIVGGVVTVVLGALETTPPEGLIIGLGGIGTLSYLFFAIDNFVSFGQAKALVHRIEAGEASLDVAEYVAPIVTPNGGVGVSAGFVGRF